MSPKTQVFVLGATGYVGGSVTDRLIRHPTFATSDISVLVRKPEKAAVFESLGVKPVLGSNDDHAILEKQASQSDVVFSIADSDNGDAISALLRGLKKKYIASGKPPIFIHTTGSAIVMDSAQGHAPDPKEEPWDDTDVARLDTIADSQPHRLIDKLILAADQEGYVKAYLVSPSLIFGFPSGKLVDLGVQHTLSIQIPLGIAASIARKRAGYVGEGLNLWPAVHNDDNADFYIVLYEAILAGKEPGHGREGIYFTENGHFYFKDISVKIGEILLEKGLTDTAEPNSYVAEDFKNFPWLVFLGSNLQLKSTRARALGWKPKYVAADLFGGIKEQVEYKLKHKV